MKEEERKINYLKIDFNKVKGYSKLSKQAKQAFEIIYKKHSQGLDNKEDWSPVKVIQRDTHLEVHFKNGEWLHYLPNGTWY